MLETRWEAEHDGHNVVVTRNELGRGFKLEWDGVEIARRAWSFFGLGELHGTATSGDKHYDVRVALEWAGFSELNGSCTITVDGVEIPSTRVR
jgi:hypothetical protein